MDEKTIARFWAKVDIKPCHECCWPWKAGCNQRGYGNIRVCGRVVGAHRVSMEIAAGPIPRWAHVCHRCDNPHCVNPRHLFLGSAYDNVQDSLAKGRHYVGAMSAGEWLRQRTGSVV
jgi:HNH endonuclease